MNPKRLLVLIMTAGLVSSCSMRSTTTDRTAIEQALLSESAVRSVAQMDFKQHEGKSFFIKEDKFEAVDGKFVMGEVRNKLLEDGLRGAAKEEDADLLVWPRSGAHGIDDSKFLLGIPSIPIPIPTVGTLETPELALFKLERQRGRDRSAIVLEDRETGALAQETGAKSAQVHYDRWVILIFIGFRTTNLGRPF